MRTMWMVLAAGLLTGGAAIGQAPGQLLEDRVDTILREWSNKTASIKSLYITFNRTTKDVVWRKTKHAAGSARYLAPTKARLDIEKSLGGNVESPLEEVESLVMPGNREIWHFKVPTRQITIYEIPKESSPQNALEDGPLPFLFATKPEKAKERYSFEILEETPELVRARIKPRLKEDQANFQYAEVTLDKTNDFLPKRLFFVEATNENEVTFDFTAIHKNIPINETDFACEELGRSLSSADREPDRRWVILRKQVEGQSQVPGATSGRALQTGLPPR